MNTAWKNPKIIIGSVAEGDYYYKRESIIESIWEEVQKGNSVLLAAPRRVGKTSIMKDIENNPLNDYLVIFKNIESIKSEQDLYREIYTLLLKSLSKSKKYKNLFLGILKKIKIEEVDFLKGSFKLEHQDLNYLDAINQLLPQIKEANILLLIDELPEVLHNLNRNQKQEEAVSILKTFRTWRQENLYNKLRFVLAGSIGIHYVVNAIEGRPDSLNDLRKIPCSPFDKEEAMNYIRWAIDEASIQMSDTVINHLANKVNYFVPYFLNLLIDQVNNNAKRTNKPGIIQEHINLAFAEVVKSNDYFNDWRKRLEDYLPKVDFKFVNEILVFTAHKEQISIQQIFNLAVKHKFADNYMDFISDLEQDGYLINQDDFYYFSSPYLQAFWKRIYPIYND